MVRRTVAFKVLLLSLTAGAAAGLWLTGGGWAARLTAAQRPSYWHQNAPDTPLFPETPPPPRPWILNYRSAADRIIGKALGTTAAWDRLAEMTDTFGPRLTGSEALERTIAWAADQMRRDGLENVRTEPVQVPRWVRGRESLRIISPVEHDLVLLGLGGSVGTPAGGLEAPVLVVRSFEDLERHADAARGRIVVFNVPFRSYPETVQYRTTGAARAARHGAVGVLVRSIGPRGFRTPHTGGMRYQDGLPRIPAAAIPAEDADWLDRLASRGDVRVRLAMEAETLPDGTSANLIAELRGAERPDEVVVIGGHIDSWDVGTGASDDGGGCIATWEALRILTELGLRPRRTIRLVLFTNEENGLRGGLAYRDAHREELSRHVLMFESDSGLFDPRGFGFTGDAVARGALNEIASLLTGVWLDRIGPNGGGADIGPSVQAANIPSLSLATDAERYFEIHHTPADTVDKIDPRDMARAVAGIAVMAYVVADMPQRLGDILTE